MNQDIGRVSPSMFNRCGAISPSLALEREFAGGNAAVPARRCRRLATSAGDGAGGEAAQISQFQSKNESTLSH